mgnify:CR=1 FL=1
MMRRYATLRGRWAGGRGCFEVADTGGGFDGLGEGIGAMMKKPPHVPVNGWNYYIRVPSIDAAKASVKTDKEQIELQLEDIRVTLEEIDRQRGRVPLRAHQHDLQIG